MDTKLIVSIIQAAGRTCTEDASLSFSIDDKYGLYYDEDRKVWEVNDADDPLDDTFESDDPRAIAESALRIISEFENRSDYEGFDSDCSE